MCSPSRTTLAAVVHPTQENDGSSTTLPFAPYPSLTISSTHILRPLHYSLPPFTNALTHLSSPSNANSPSSTSSIINTSPLPLLPGDDPDQVPELIPIEQSVCPYCGNVSCTSQLHPNSATACHASTTLQSTDPHPASNTNLPTSPTNGSFSVASTPLNHCPEQITNLSHLCDQPWRNRSPPFPPPRIIAIQRLVDDDSSVLFGPVTKE